MPAAATAVCECDAATSLLPQQQSENVTPQRHWFLRDASAINAGAVHTAAAGATWER